MDALKEWATVVGALESGDQTVILRKGGILETSSGFKIESSKFLLFPTFEHQEERHIKPQFQKYLKVVKEKSGEGFNKIGSYAEVLEEKDISSDRVVNELSSFHIWSDHYIQERRDWMPEKPLKAVFLKVYVIPQIEIPLKSEYQGCKSWIDINGNFQNGKPVLNHSNLNQKLEKFRSIVR